MTTTARRDKLLRRAHRAGIEEPESLSTFRLEQALGELKPNSSLVESTTATQNQLKAFHEDRTIVNAGSSTLRVLIVTAMLSELGDHGEVAQFYDHTVARRIRQFQREAGLEDTGVIDGATWAAMAERFVPFPGDDEAPVVVEVTPESEPEPPVSPEPAPVPAAVKPAPAPAKSTVAAKRSPAKSTAAAKRSRIPGRRGKTKKGKK